MAPTKHKISRSKLRPDWYVHTNKEEFDLNRSGIYEWRIDGGGVYVGKAKVLRERVRAYPNNVGRMIDGLPWHGDPTKDYRLVHRELRKAYDDCRSVSVVVLENCDSSVRAKREQWWIRKRQDEALAGGPRVLN